MVEGTFLLQSMNMKCLRGHTCNECSPEKSNEDKKAAGQQKHESDASKERDLRVAARRHSVHPAPFPPRHTPPYLPAPQEGGFALAKTLAGALGGPHVPQASQPCKSCSSPTRWAVCAWCRRRTAHHALTELLPQASRLGTVGRWGGSAEGTKCPHGLALGRQAGAVGSGYQGRGRGTRGYQGPQQAGWPAGPVS